MNIILMPNTQNKADNTGKSQGKHGEFDLDLIVATLLLGKEPDLNYNFEEIEKCDEQAHSFGQACGLK